MQSKTRSKKLKRLDDWEWTTLVAAWRYFEYRNTIASAGFPCDIVERYFRGAYDDESCRRIAIQFVQTDHFRGESDWSGAGLRDCDNEMWCKLWAFLNGYLDGFKNVVLDGKDANGKRLHEEVKAFYCSYTRRWYPVERYVANPYLETFCDEKYIKEVR